MTSADGLLVDPPDEPPPQPASAAARARVTSSAAAEIWFALIGAAFTRSRTPQRRREEARPHLETESLPFARCPASRRPAGRSVSRLRRATGPIRRRGSATGGGSPSRA